MSEIGKLMHITSVGEVLLLSAHLWLTGSEPHVQGKVYHINCMGYLLASWCLPVGISKLISQSELCLAWLRFSRSLELGADT